MLEKRRLGLTGAIAVAAMLGVAVAVASAQDALGVKERYVRFLVGTDATFSGALGEEAAAAFLDRVKRPVEKAMAFDLATDAGKPFRAFPEDPGFKDEVAVYSPLLQQALLPLAYAYCVNTPGSPWHHDAKVLDTYVKTLDYLYSRGIRDGMTFHNNQHRMNMQGAPRPGPGMANLPRMELRMGALCQSVLLMEPYIADTETYRHARALVRHLEMLGRTSGHVRYYEPYTNPLAFRYRVQSDAIQNFGDTTLVSALLEADSGRQDELLTEAQHVYSDSLKVIPGWADTIKPDFTGFHHRGIYGNAYTGGFIPQAAFGAYVLGGTRYAVAPQSVENLKQLMLTYRLYCQKYAMPFGIRGRMPEISVQLKTEVFAGILIAASDLGLSDDAMKPVLARLWDPEQVGLRFAFAGGRGKLLRGLYTLDMLRDLLAAAPAPEPDPSGFWPKPYGGLAIHRRDNWMAAVKGYSKYVWDYENGKAENAYGQYLSHGMLTIFAQGDPVSDIASGYRLAEGWDWYRLPGTTAVHFPLKPVKALDHRRFSPETFLGAVSADGRNGAWGMILNDETFPDGTRIDLKARKSLFFFDDLIVALGSGISGGDGRHAVETTLFQCFVSGDADAPLAVARTLADSAGNGYFVPKTDALRVSSDVQKSFRYDGKTPTSGRYGVAWLDHGLRPRDGAYEFAILVRGAERIGAFAKDPAATYVVERRDNALHQVRFPRQNATAYVFFEPGEPVEGVVARVDTPCLLMAQTDSERRLRLAVTSPDLGLLAPDAPVPDFRFIARNENQYLPSRPRPVTVSLRGSWTVAGPPEGAAVISSDASGSVLRFACIDGVPVAVSLIKK